VYPDRSVVTNHVDALAARDHTCPTMRRPLSCHVTHAPTDSTDLGT
jgi:hypothetical protein